jgi:ankyrin repeat protein
MELAQDRPLWSALLFRRFDIARQLLATKQASLSDLIDEDGYTLLHYSSMDGDLETVSFLLSCPGALQLHTSVTAGLTPLLLAVDRRNVEVVKLLLANGVDPNIVHSFWSQDSPLQRAVERGSPEMVSMLLQAGADPRLPGNMGITPLMQLDYRIDGGLHSPQAREIRQLLIEAAEARSASD